jgi:glycosyltransferase involved in cell wall biosynthesis
MTKILFIGLAESSHTTSWIELLENSEIEYRLFALPTGARPDSLKIPVYLSSHRFFLKPKQFPIMRISSIARIKSLILFLKLKLNTNFARRIRKYFKIKEVKSKAIQFAVIPSLISVIKRFKPDIVHTLGVFDASVLFREVSPRFPSINWVMQVRGGPDLDYYYLIESRKSTIQDILSKIDYLICDSEFNYNLAEKLGADTSKFKLGVVSGAGGVKLKSSKNRTFDKNSQTVIWPKAHEGVSAKALPILEAIKLALSEIVNINFEIFCLDQEEVQLWIQSNLPSEIRERFKIYERVGREEFMSHLSKSQVLLSPSLMDGIPNVLIESMALGVVPIVSPLNTIKEFVSDPENVYFARNLYPNEIANALIKSLSEETCNERKIENNYDLVKKIYDRDKVRLKVNEFYNKIGRTI